MIGSWALSVDSEGEPVAFLMLGFFLAWYLMWANHIRTHENVALNKFQFKNIFPLKKKKSITYLMSFKLKYIK